MGFFDVLIRPEEVFKGEVKRASFGAAILPYVIIGLVMGIGLGLLLLAAGVLFMPFLTNYGVVLPAMVKGLFGGTGLIIGFLLGIVGYPLMVLVGTGALFLIAKLFGGKGTFVELLYLNSLLVWPLAVAGLLVSIVAAICMAIFPPLGMLVNFAFHVYGVYLAIVALKVALKLEWVQSILTFVVLWLICAVIAAIIAIFVVLAVFGSFGGMMGMLRG